MKKTITMLCVCALLAAAVLSFAGCSAPTISYTLDVEDTYISLTFSIPSDWTMEASEDSVEQNYYDAQGKLVLALDIELPDSVLDSSGIRNQKFIARYEQDNQYSIISKEDTTVDGIDAVKLIISDSADTQNKQDTIFIFSDNGYFIYSFRIKGSDTVKEESIEALRVSIDVDQPVSILSQGTLVFEDESEFTMAIVEYYGTNFIVAKLYCANSSTVENIETVFAASAYCNWAANVLGFGKYELCVREVASDTVGSIKQNLVNGEWEFDEYTRLPACFDSEDYDLRSEENMRTRYDYLLDNFKLD